MTKLMVAFRNFANASKNKIKCKQIRQTYLVYLLFLLIVEF